MAKNLILYDKYNKIINTTLDVIGTTGTITIENLTPETDYPEGEFYVGWEVNGKNLPKATVPEFTTLRQMREKVVIVYFSDLTEQQLVDIKGDSAYKIALDNGFKGSQEEWLKSLKGEPGIQGEKGEPGKDGVDITEGGSAYEIAQAHGFEGTREEWLESLKGEPGKQGEKGEPGEDGFGVDGASAYEIALENGFIGNIQDFLDSLVGEPGKDGMDGTDGLSAYEIALENGYTGTESEWLESLKANLPDTTNWQKRKVTSDDGTVITVDKPNLNAPDTYFTNSGFYYVTTSTGFPEGVNANGYVTFLIRNPKYSIMTFQPYNSERVFTKAKLNGSWGYWNEIGGKLEDRMTRIKVVDIAMSMIENELGSIDDKIEYSKNKSMEDPYYNEIVYNTYFDNNSKSIYHVVDIPHMDKDGNLIKLKTEKPIEPTTAREISNKYQHSAVINSSVFNTRTLEPSGVQIQDGEIIGDKRSGTLRTLGIKDDNTLVDFTSDVTAQEILNQGIKNTVTGFYPILNGEEKPYATVENASSNVNEQHPRQIIAQKPNKDLMFITVEGRNADSAGMSYDQMYDLCKGLGASYAYCLDGGGSTQTVVRGNLLNRQVDNNGMSERKVPDFLYVTKDSDNKNSIVSQNYDTGNITKKLTEIMYTMSNINGIPSNLSTTSNLDTIDKTGFYWVRKNTIGAPGTWSYGVLHFQITANESMQVAFPYHESAEEIKYRRTIGTGTTNKWRDWRGNDTTVWNGLTLDEGWSNYGNGEPGFGYSKQGNKVYLKGTIQGSSTSNVICILPEELRPKVVHVFPSTSREGEQYKASAIKININGVIEIMNPSPEWNVISTTYLL